jgi:DDE_Tnp_1-associated/Transposase DDE domain
MEPAPTLMEVFRSLDDPRRAQGRRHPLEAILALTTVAILSGMTSIEGVVQFGRERGYEFLRLLGFTRRRGPSKATLSRVFAVLDPAAIDAAISRWIRGRTAGRAQKLVALDGKTLRGSRRGAVPGVHLLAAYAPEVQAVLGQLRVDGKTNEHKAALEFLGVIPLRGKVVTADAMFTHRDFCREVRRRGGDYVLPVEENQPNLRGDIEAAFSALPPGLSPPAAPVAPAEPAACRDDRQGPWASREADHRDDPVAERLLGLA